jgi:peroxiredoxin
MSDVTIIMEEISVIPGSTEGGRVLIDRALLEEATGWVRKPEGLCRGDVCVPVRDAAALEVGEQIDLAGFASALGRRSVVDVEAGMVAISLDAADRSGALQGLRAPDFTLPTLDGVPVSLNDFEGTKRVLVAFSSWCGCRYDLPGWQALADELAETGLTIITVALDNDPEDVRPFTEGIEIPVLLDRQHLLSELYAMSNVPTVVWIDEQGGIARPNGLMFGTTTFAEFTGVDSTPHLEAIRRWARSGELPIDPDEARGAVEDLSADEIDARLHFRLGVEAERVGNREVARHHLERASELTPFDFSVRRAAMPLLGVDPFGQEFLDLYDEWQEQGAPYHGLPVD